MDIERIVEVMSELPEAKTGIHGSGVVEIMGKDKARALLAALEGVGLAVTEFVKPVAKVEPKPFKAEYPKAEPYEPAKPVVSAKYPKVEPNAQVKYPGVRKDDPAYPMDVGHGLEVTDKPKAPNVEPKVQYPKVKAKDWD